MHQLQSAVAVASAAPASRVRQATLSGMWLQSWFTILRFEKKLAFKGMAVRPPL